MSSNYLSIFIWKLVVSASVKKPKLFAFLQLRMISLYSGPELKGTTGNSIGDGETKTRDYADNPPTLFWISRRRLRTIEVHCGPEQLKIQTEVLGHSLVRSLVRSHRSLVELAPPCSLRSRAPLRSLVRSLAHFAHSLTRGTVNNWMAI